MNFNCSIEKMKKNHLKISALILLMSMFSVSCERQRIDEPEVGQLNEKAKQNQERLIQSIQKFEEELKNLEELVETKNNNEYWSTKEFKDKYGKKELGLANPGEKLIMINEFESELESNKIYKENVAKINEIESKIKNYFESNKKETQKIEQFEIAREIHVQNEDSTWIWFNLMMDIDRQLEKLSIANKSSDVIIFEEYIDLRIPGKIFYK